MLSAKLSFSTHICKIERMISEDTVFWICQVHACHVGILKILDPFTPYFELLQARGPVTWICVSTPRAYISNGTWVARNVSPSKINKSFIAAPHTYQILAVHLVNPKKGQKFDFQYYPPSWYSLPHLPKSIFGFIILKSSLPILSHLDTSEPRQTQSKQCHLLLELNGST